LIATRSRSSTSTSPARFRSIPISLLGPGVDAVVVFTGGYAHDPNLDAAIRLMRSIMPRMRDR
jgi:hypothetical protein